MKMINELRKGTGILFSCILCLAVGGGCATDKPVKLKGNIQQSVVVVPVKGPPVELTHQTAGAAAVGTVVGGVVGATIVGPLVGDSVDGVAAAHRQDKAATGKKQNLATRLTSALPNWQPERILAEECMKVLRESGRQSFREATLADESKLMEGAAELFEGQPYPFNPEPSGGTKRVSVPLNWLKSPPSGMAGNEGKLLLEVAFFGIVLNKGDSLEVNCFLRLVDPAQGKILGMTGYVSGIFKIAPVTPTSDPQGFANEFRRCMSELARTGLKRLKVM